MEMLRTQMKEQEDAIREEQAETLASIQKAQGELSTRTLIRQYVQDLYRFFHLHYTRSQYTSPFDKNWLTDSERTLHDTLRFSKKVCSPAPSSTSNAKTTRMPKLVLRY